MRRRAAILTLLTAVLAFAATATATATTREYVLKHPKREHCKSHYVKKTRSVRRKVHGHVVKVRETVCVHSGSGKSSPGPTSNAAKPEECTPLVSGTGQNPETHLYSYQVILGCFKGSFGSFQVSTNRAIAAGTITANRGSRGAYACSQTSSTSFSCTGETVGIPPGGVGAAVRAFFKSSQPPCEGTSPETAVITMAGVTFNAAVGEAQGSC